MMIRLNNLILTIVPIVSEESYAEKDSTLYLLDHYNDGDDSIIDVPVYGQRSLPLGKLTKNSPLRKICTAKWTDPNIGLKILESGLGCLGNAIYDVWKTKQDDWGEPPDDIYTLLFHEQHLSLGNNLTFDPETATFELHGYNMMVVNNNNTCDPSTQQWERRIVLAWKHIAQCFYRDIGDTWGGGDIQLFRGEEEPSLLGPSSNNIFCGIFAIGGMRLSAHQ